jgi:hypothetical protein
MGDRTWVNIHIRKSDYDRIVREDFEGNEDKFESAIYVEEKDDSHYGDHIIQLYASEINYAEWSELESLLKDKQIEFNKDWGDGGEYSAGEAFFRLVKGKYKSVEIYSSQQSELNVLNEIYKMIEDGKDIKSVKKAIDKKIKQLMPFDPEPLHKPNSVRYIQED